MNALTSLRFKEFPDKQTMEEKRNRTVYPIESISFFTVQFFLYIKNVRFSEDSEGE
jgi:hypothetical protein